MVKPKPWVMEAPIYKPRTYRGIVARLDMNESPNPPPEHVLRAAERELARMNRYPDVEIMEALVEALADYAEVGREEVLPAAGSDMVIRAIFDAYVDRGDRVCFPRYGFAMYSIYSRLLGARPRLIEMSVMGDEFRVREEELESLGGCRVFFIDRPNNPTGSPLIDAGLLRGMVEEYGETLFVVDEAYYEYYGETLKDLALGHGNVIVTRTLSKAFGLASMRVGYAIARDEALDPLRRALPPFPITRPSAAAAIAALEDPGYVYEHVRQVDQLKSLVYGRVSEMGARPYRSRANFLLIEMPVEGVEKKLREKGVAVRPTVLGERWIRVTMGTRGEVDLFLNALEEVLGERP